MVVPVSTKVNDVRNQGPELIEPVTLEAEGDGARGVGLAREARDEEPLTLGLLA